MARQLRAHGRAGAYAISDLHGNHSQAHGYVFNVPNATATFRLWIDLRAQFFGLGKLLNAHAVATSFVLLSIPLTAQTPASHTGRWLVAEDYLGVTRYIRLDLVQESQQVSGTLGGVKLQGTLTEGHLVLSGKSEGESTTLDASSKGAGLEGKITITSANDPVNLTLRFTASPVPALKRSTPKRHEFTPTVFYRQFSPFNQPVLTVSPGDTIHTTTVDAGGNDQRGIKRVAGGNPQTGPFYVEGAMPGDTLVVHLNRLELNRDWAGSNDGLVQSALGPDLAVKTKDNNHAIKWHLDLGKMTGSPEPASEHMRKFAVPLHPMLGCIATAPGPAGAPPPTGDSGSYGGNMDFNEIADGATVYLPVFNPGALLYLGDAHALQGDGELNGNALETSMSVDFTVDVIPGKRISGPRVETADAVISMGLNGSLDDAFREATSGMAEWLAADYSLTPSELGQVLGVAS